MECHPARGISPRWCGTETYRGKARARLRQRDRERDREELRDGVCKSMCAPSLQNTQMIVERRCVPFSGSFSGFSKGHVCYSQEHTHRKATLYCECEDAHPRIVLQYPRGIQSFPDTQGQNGWPPHRHNGAGINPSLLRVKLCRFSRAQSLSRSAAASLGT